MEAILFIILQIFFVLSAVLKIGQRDSDIPHIESRDVFRPIALDIKYLMNYL